MMRFKYFESLNDFLITLFILLCFAFPKAGAVVGDTTITVQEIVFLLLLIINFKKIKELIYKDKKVFGFVIVLIFFSIIIFLLNIPNFSLFWILSTVVFVVSPLGYYLCDNININKINKILCFSILITCLFAIIQYIFGIEETKIPGLTIAFGDSYSSKPIGWTSEGTAIKIPSTYQNGNGFGLFLSLTIPYLIANRFKQRKWQILKYIAVVLGFFGLFLAGSRTAVISFLLASIVIAIFNLHKIQNFKIRKNFLVLFYILIIAAIIAITINWDYIYSRFILSLLNDTSGNGRLPQYERLKDTFFDESVLRNIFFGISWDRAVYTEGFLCILSHHGLFVMLIYVFFLFSYLFDRNISFIIKIGLLATLISFSVDSSFHYMPGVINYFIIVYCAKKVSLDQHKEGVALEYAQ